MRDGQEWRNEPGGIFLMGDFLYVGKEVGRDLGI